MPLLCPALLLTAVSSLLRCLPDEEVVLNVPLEGEEEVAF